MVAAVEEVAAREAATGVAEMELDAGLDDEEVVHA